MCQLANDKTITKYFIKTCLDKREKKIYLARGNEKTNISDDLRDIWMFEYHFIKVNILS
jgi:hypothetical protein